MKKFNWKKKFRNKTFVVTFATSSIAFGYQILSLFEIVPKVSEDAVTQGATLVINGLTTLGIIIDPNTDGITDKESEVVENE